jgi:hypothetical protein
VQVADRAQALLGLVHRELGGEPLAQQTPAAALHVTVRPGLPLGLVQLREGGPRQFRQGLLARGREVGQPARTLLHAEVRAGDRVEGDELVDVGVGDFTGQRALGLRHAAHPHTATMSASPMYS